MPVPQMGGCCMCREAIVPDCFGCPRTYSRFDFAATRRLAVQVNCNGPTWDLSTTGSCSDVAVFSPSPTNPDANTVTVTRNFNYYAQPLDDLAGPVTLRARQYFGQPGAPPIQGCIWMWNRVTAVHSAYEGGTNGFLDETFYEPLNAVDPTNPWERVYTYVSPLCSGSPRCFDWDYRVTVQLFVAGSGPLNSVMQLPVLPGYYWAVKVFASPVFSGTGFHEFRFPSVNTPSYTIPAFAGGQPRVTDPPRFFGSQQSWPQISGGPECNTQWFQKTMLAWYVKPVSCSEDFVFDTETGTKTLTLPLHWELPQHAAVGTVMAPEVTVQLVDIPEDENA